MDTWFLVVVAGLGLWGLVTLGSMGPRFLAGTQRDWSLLPMTVAAVSALVPTLLEVTAVPGPGWLTWALSGTSTAGAWLWAALHGGRRQTPQFTVLAAGLALVLLGWMGGEPVGLSRWFQGGLTALPIAGAGVWSWILAGSSLRDSSFLKLIAALLVVPGYLVGCFVETVPDSGNGILLWAGSYGLFCWAEWKGRRVVRKRVLVSPALLPVEWGLSEREQEVALLLLRGVGGKEIAYQLKISQATVKNHIYNIYQKAKVRSRLEFYELARGSL